MQIEVIDANERSIKSLQFLYTEQNQNRVRTTTEQNKFQFSRTAFFLFFFFLNK